MIFKDNVCYLFRCSALCYRPHYHCGMCITHINNQSLLLDMTITAFLLCFNKFLSLSKLLGVCANSDVLGLVYMCSPPPLHCQGDEYQGGL